MVETAGSHGILGMLIATVSKSSQTLQHSNEIIAIAHSWRGRQGQFQSTITTFAHNLLFTDESSSQSSRLSHVLTEADMQVKFTMAMAMIERNHFTQAHALLTACAKALKSKGPVDKDQYFPMMTELVKCCNILDKAEQGESTALEALQHPDSHTALQEDICCMHIALADALIGQSKYLEADKLLQKVLAREYISNYLMIVASLRLNKVRRRLNVVDISAFTRNGALLKVVTYANESGGHITGECLEELSCTVNFVQQRTTENAKAAEAILETAIAVAARQPISTSHWRARMLREQTANGSRQPSQEEQRFYQYPAKGSVGAGVPQESVPLRILLVVEDVKADTGDKYALQASNHPLLALEEVINLMRAEGDYGNSKP